MMRFVEMQTRQQDSPQKGASLRRLRLPDARFHQDMYIYFFLLGTCRWCLFKTILATE